MSDIELKNSDPNRIHWQCGSLSINASAGFGKTEKLVIRLSALLLSDAADIDSVLALTFSRAAAGEILERLLQVLVGSLRSEEKFAEFKNRLGESIAEEEKFAGVDPSASQQDVFAELKREDVLALVETLVRNMHRLNIGTLDSFFTRIIMYFPYELGLPGRAAMLPEQSSIVLRRNLLLRLFSSSGDPDFAAFCRELMHGREKKSLLAVSEDIIDELHEFYHCRDNGKIWGTPFINKFSKLPQEEIDDAVERCNKSGPDVSGDYAAKLQPLVDKCRRLNDPELRFSTDERDILKAFWKAWNSGSAGKPAGFSRGWSFTEEFLESLRLLFMQAMDVLLVQAARRTAAMGRLLAGYSELYRKNVLMQGNIRFPDLPKLLANDGSSEWHNEIEYRMNSRFRHVLVDEFQDTSREQWAVLEPMTGDSGDGDHSLFVVGDVKQAIYGWRGGDSVLMEDVAVEIKKSGGTEVQLEKSYRYGDGMIEGLNHFFRDRLLNSPAFPKEIRDRWSRHYPKASSARDSKSSLRVVGIAPKKRQPSDCAEMGLIDRIARMIVDSIREYGVVENNLSCAVLLRSGKKVVELFEALVSVAPELKDKLIVDGKDNLGDDPLVAALLAAAVMLRHPGDGLAAALVRMTPPLRRIMPDDAAGKRQWLQLLDSGIAVFLTALLKKLRYPHGEKVDEPCFWNPRLDLLLSAAAEFDRRCPGGEILTFRSEMQKYAVGDVAVAGKIRLMTIHSSKGLTFDTVFVPFADTHSGTSNLSSLDPGDFIADLSSPGKEWILCNPGVEIISSKSELLKAAEKIREQRAFESLCVLYVAMTRARYSTTVILPPPGSTIAGNFHPDWSNKEGMCRNFEREPLRDDPSKSCYLDEMLFEAFFYDDDIFPTTEGGLPEKSTGEVVFIERIFGEKWYPLTKKTEERKEVPVLRPPLPAAGELEQHLKRMVPSQQEENKLYFSLPEKSSGTELGTELHRFFEKIDHLCGSQPPEDDILRRHYENCVASPEISALLNEEYSELWKERTFDVILTDGGGKVWVSGCFDRVQICRDEKGMVQRAVIIDYKSNQCDSSNLDDLTAHYTPQLEVYRRALAVLLGITPNLIECRLIFTACGEMREV